MAELEFREEERQTAKFHRVVPSELRLRISRRRMAPVPLAWADRVRHAIFVGGIILMALSPGGLAEKVGVLGFSLAYALSLASERRPVAEAVEEAVDDEGVRRTVEGRTTRIAWDEVASYRVPSFGMGGIGLFGADHRLRTILGGALDEDGGSVTHALWNRLGRRLAARLPYGAAEDPRWQAHLRGIRWRTAAGAAGMALCLSPIFIRSFLRITEHQAAGLLFAGFILTAAIFLFVTGIGISKGKEPTGEWPEARDDEPVLAAFLDARDGDLPPTKLEIGKRYRYLPAPEAVGSLPGIGIGLPHALYVGLMQAGLLLRIEWIATVVFISCGLAFLIDMARLRLGALLARGRHGEFAVADGDLVVRVEKGEERYPLNSFRTISLNRAWFEFGGEVEEYRNGRRRFYLDRRFLVPVEGQDHGNLDR
jgi:hypothetical protein